MNSTQINAKIKLKGYTSSLISEALNLTPSFVSSVIAGKQKSKRVAIAVAKVIDASIEEAFPNIVEYHPGYKKSDERAAKVAEIRAHLSMAS